jgi:hypothetical protein
VADLDNFTVALEGGSVFDDLAGVVVDHATNDVFSAD